MDIIILSGIPGSGKTTWRQRHYPTVSGKVSVVSANAYFERDGEFRFNPALLDEAHGSCFRQYLRILASGQDGICIVDNTNTTAWEISPYVLAASAFGKHKVRVVTFMCENYGEAKDCARRNIHGAPMGVVLAQHSKLIERVLPPWWQHEIHSVSFAI